jgi:hypothetical protein
LHTGIAAFIHFFVPNLLSCTGARRREKQY